jgi:glucose/mannose transport system substrate-binding protein
MIRGGELEQGERLRGPRAGLLFPFIIALLSSAACGIDTGTVTLEVYSWWRQPSEFNAFEDVIQIHEARYPGEQVENRADPSATDARDVMTERLLAGAPPSSFQANAGADMLQWTVVDSDRLPSTRVLRGLGDFFQRLNLTKSIPDPVLQTLYAGSNEPYAVPINIHRLNVLYYNTQLLGAFREKYPDKTFLDLASLCPADPAAAPLDLKIAVGARDTFVLVLLAFESALPALAGADFYESFFQGSPPSEWETQIRKALSCVQYLSRSFNTDYADRNWAEAADMVQSGDATFTVMGDWANGQIKPGLDDQQVDSVPFPGSESIFVFTADTFPLPLLAPHPQETEHLLETIASADAQYDFSAEKGSIPALDIDLTRLGERALRTQQDFASDRKVLATSGLFPPYYPVDQLGQLLIDMTRPRAGQAEIDAVVTLLRDSEPLLQRWQARLTKGAAAPAGSP